MVVLVYVKGMWKSVIVNKICSYFSMIQSLHNYAGKLNWRLDPEKKRKKEELIPKPAKKKKNQIKQSVGQVVWKLVQYSWNEKEYENKNEMTQYE